MNNRILVRNVVVGLAVALAVWAHAGGATSTIGFAITNYFVPEGLSSVTPAIALVRDGDVSGAAAVGVRVVGGTATPDTDFTLDPLVSFVAGQTNGFLALGVRSDGVEPEETIELTLTDLPEGMATDAATATIHILAQPLTLRWSADGSTPSYSVDESAQAYNLLLYRFGPIELPQRIRVRSVDGTAKAGTDYQPIDQVLEFGPRVAQLPVTIQPINDAVNRGNRGFRLLTENMSPEVVLRTLPSVTVTIVDNDLGYSAYSDATWNAVRETDPVGVRVSVVRAGDFGPSTLDYYTVSGTALEGVDFVATRGTLSFDPGSSYQSRTIVIPLLADTEIEPTERFRLVLTNTVPKVPFQPGSTPVLTLQIADVPAGYRFGALLDNPSQSWIEVNESDPSVRVAVRRVGYANTTGSVQFSTEDGTAKAGADYVATNGTLEFSADTTQQWITVPLINDGLREATETFRIRLSDASGAAPVADTNLTVRILDNDPGFAFQYTPFQVGEQSPEAVLSVWRGSDQLDPASVRYQTDDGTAKTGLDYVATQGVLEFGAGETYKEIRIPLLNDALRESDESFRVRLFEPSAGTSLGNPSVATVVIQDNEIGYQAGVASAPNEENGDLVFRIDRVGDFVSASSVGFRVVPGRDTTTPAVPGADFTPVSGQLTFTPGVTSQEVHIPNLNDTVADGPKTVRLELYEPVGEVPISTAFTECTIYDNEIGYGPGDSLDAYTGWAAVTEIEGSVVLIVSRQGDFDVASTVEVEVGPGPADNPDVPPAVPGRDFEPTRETLTFAPGQTNATFRVTLHTDGRADGDKAITVSLSKPSAGVPVATPSWTVLLRDAENPLARVDPEFHPAEGRLAAAAWSWDRVARVSLVPLTDGRVLTTTDAAFVGGRGGGTLLVRLMPDGSIDPGFAPFENVGLWSATGQGIVHVVGVDGGLLRLDASGRPDPAFYFQPVTNAYVAVLASRDDGGAFVVVGDQTGSYRVSSLRADGHPDAGFTAPILGQPIRQLLPLSSGGLVLSGNDLTAEAGTWLGAVTVLGPDGKIVPSADGERRLTNVERLGALSDGRLAAQATDPDTGERTFYRLTATGAIDPDFTPIRGGFLFAADADRLWLLRLNPTTGRHRLERRLLDGSLDPAANAQLVELELLNGGRVGGWGGGGGGGLAAASVSRASAGQALASPRALQYFNETSFWWRPPPEAYLPSLAADGHGGLFLGNVARVNGHLRLGVARLDVAAPADHLELLPADERLAENVGRTTVALVRTGDWLVPRSFRWSTSGGTAVAGVDYEPASGTLEFAAGQPSASITLTLLDNTALDTDRTLRLAITDASGVVLPPIEITIVNDDLGFLSPGILPVPGGGFLLRPTGHLIRRDDSRGAAIPSSTHLGSPPDNEYWIDAWSDEAVIWPGTSSPGFLRLRR